ncbi:MAG TPA: GNAT family N-acetyltransferase [Devosiaceae bacterium]|jgi:hypothetical protein|nr:GNAT family N-acetyltransferase [Devosiaceae bacterium]
MTQLSSLSDLPGLADSHATRDAIEVSFVSDRAEWDSLLTLAPFPHLPQSFAYGEGKSAKGWTTRRAVFVERDRPVALASVLERQVLGLRVLTRLNRGPVFLEATPRPGQIGAVHAALRRHWRGPLLLAPALESTQANCALLRAAGYVRRQRQGWTSGRIDLARSEDEIWRGFGSTFRNRVRQAEKSGATLRVADDAATYEWMLARHTENMREKGFRAADATLLRALRDAAPADVTVLQLLREGRPVSGMSVVRFGHIAEYHVGWFGPEGRKLNGGNFLMWHAIREMKRRGVLGFDVGGLKPGDGYTRFKRTMNPVEYELAGEWMSF